MVRSSRHTQYGQEEAGGQCEWKQLVRARSCIPGGDRWLFLTSWSKPGAAALAACTAVRNGASAFARPVKSLAASPAAKSYPPHTPGSACWRLAAGSSPPPISSAFKLDTKHIIERAALWVFVNIYWDITWTNCSRITSLPLRMLGWTPALLVGSSNSRARGGLPLPSGRLRHGGARCTILPAAAPAAPAGAGPHGGPAPLRT